jgi:hypothetical protein
VIATPYNGHVEQLLVVEMVVTASPTRSITKGVATLPEKRQQRWKDHRRGEDRRCQHPAKCTCVPEHC